ncbi:hypothetical protein FGG08_000852 [Glutinoglossum americanum]|uniref:GAF domain-containing protein n=1 Tax=Glutinoglossum americanum TaxID=1670608 RepID=A0A9P8L3E6_9PEZI|nr:hypothetical protein FGG08_000852 [Glutinoglossum americanum]
MVGSRSLKLKRSLSRITSRQEKGAPTDYPPVPSLDTDNIDYSEPVFERPAYLQPLATRSLSETASTSRRTSAASPISAPTSPTRTELFSRSIDLLAAHQSLPRAQQQNNATIEETSGLFSSKANLLDTHQLVMHQEPTVSPVRPDNKMFTQAKMVLVEQAAGSGSTHPTSQISLAASGQQTIDRSRFLKRIFSRQNKSSKNQSALEQSQYGEFDYDHIGSDIPKMGPSPHTHPLLAKPYARDELTHHRPHSKHCERLSESTIPTARRKGELALASRSVSVKSTTGESPKSNGSNANNSPESNNSDPGEGETAAVVANAAIEVKYGQEWDFFIRCYAEGRFNISNPPDPPPRPPNFSYLTAPAPPDEVERLRAVEQINLNYPDWASSKAKHLVHLARKVFGTCYASVSLVDNHNEILKAEHGYQTSSVSRDMSVGAHVLLSTNSMVILDTGKDWRLQENPLVTGAPHIRFYAGAPLITPEGYVVGVFAIFDTKPRNDFPLHFRRKLADFTKIANADIEILVEEQEMLKDKDTGGVSEQEPIGRANTEDQTEESSIRENRVTEKLLQNIEEESKQAQGVRSVGNGARANPMENTISHDLFVRDNKLEDARPDFPEPLNVPSKPQARPWNVGSAVAITPPETPSRTSAASNESSSLKQTVSTPSGTNRSPSLSSDYDHPYVSRKHRKGVPKALKDTSKLELKVDVANDQPHPRSPGPVSSLAEAGFALSLIAGTLNYDLVYLLRVRPNPGWDEYNEFDSLSTRILVAHGLPQPEPVFDPFIHLRALRSEGGVIYQNPNQGSGGGDDDLGYGVGVLLPLLRDNIDELPLICTTNADDTEQEDAERKALTAAKIEAYSNCKGGVVLAAFKKRPGPGHDFNNEEVSYLREMGCGMKDIFIKGDAMESSGSGGDET